MWRAASKRLRPTPDHQAVDGFLRTDQVSGPRTAPARCKMTPEYALADAHCHAQDDDEFSSLFEAVEARYVAAMGVSEQEWVRVEKAASVAPQRVIPAFGVHPWYAHLHGIEPGTLVRDVVEFEGTSTPDEFASVLQASTSSSWEGTLRTLLLKHPAAIVGEIGIDRAAVIRGTRLTTKLSHQLELTSRQLRLAGELRRPVSMHCVRGYGHLADLLRSLPTCNCPPKIMLHSFGGSKEMIKAFLALPGGKGSRVYFGFSSVINSRTQDKLYERIRSVPSDRLLLESDIDSPKHVDSALHDMVNTISEARGWSRDYTLQQTYANFVDFYACSLQSHGP